jgi:predicted phage baseplate assembly protein
MIKTSEICDDKTERRRAIKAHRGPNDTPDVNGIDYIEVDEADQRILHVHFLDKAPENITEKNVRIDGGRRIRNIQVKTVRLCDPDDPDLADCMEVIVDKAGDFSTYTLCLVEVDKSNRPTDIPLSGFDARYACVDFSFKANCPSDLDCEPEDTCPPTILVEPEIDYLAKDYASFRQLILDRLALVMPDWQERHIPDIGITLVEILAYVGDYLSYYQDAVATEAYLETARQRISIHRHVRLVDYPMHEGCNARTWLFVETSHDLSLDPGDIYFITGSNDALAVGGTMLTDVEVQKLSSSDYEVFEPLLIESILLQPRELKDPTSLAIKLREAKDAVSSYLRGQFTAGLQQLLGQYDPSSPPSDTLLGALIAELDRLIQHDNLYDQRRFAQVMLSPETMRLIQRMLQGESLNLPLLNRLLLDDAYTQEIANNQEIPLYEAHNEIPFYTWGERECCLPRGATTATLRDEWVTMASSSIEGKQQEPSKGPPTSSSQSSKPGQKAQQQEPPEEPPSSTVQQEKRARKLHLQVGDILIFEEVFGPKTGLKEDADPTHRHVVRLTRVEPGVDTLYDIPVVEIEWGVEDALPFPLCLSTIGPAKVLPGSPPDSVVRHECQLLENITIARGSVILVDYGKTVDEDLGSVPAEQTPLKCESEDTLADVQTIAGVFRPILQKAPLTFYEALVADAPFFHPAIPDPHQPVSLTPAKRLLLQDPRKAVPSIKLTGTPPDDGATPHGPAEDKDEDEDEDEDDETEAEAGGTPQDTGVGARFIAPIEWIAQRDLLESQRDDYHFVVEMDSDGFAHLRFGDGELGRMPAVGTKFHATYRVGNGPLGNVGAEAISHIVFRNTLLSGVTLRPRNPFAASGGTAPEPLAEVKLFAPHAFRSSKNLQRAITADDYARLAERNPKVQRAAAALRWTGSWYEVLVAIDPFGSEEADQALLDEVTAYLERFRRMGHDLKVVSAHYVPLDIAMTICVQPHFLRGHVKAALLDAFSNRVLPNGRLGFFHPDNLTFGQGIALSKLIATAQAIPGVQSVEVTRLERRFAGPNGEMEQEFLSIGPMEIAQLDNDRNFPEHGKIEFKMVGGR